MNSLVGIGLVISSAVARCSESSTHMTPNVLGGELTPSAVAVGDAGHWLVGRAAQDRCWCTPTVAPASTRRWPWCSHCARPTWRHCVGHRSRAGRQRGGARTRTQACTRSRSRHRGRPPGRCQQPGVRADQQGPEGTCARGGGRVAARACAAAASAAALAVATPGALLDASQCRSSPAAGAGQTAA